MGRIGAVPATECTPVDERGVVRTDSGLRYIRQRRAALDDDHVAGAGRSRIHIVIGPADGECMVRGVTVAAILEEQRGPFPTPNL